MSNNKARNSILFMFDPLKTPSTPRRDPSPESGSSDKENDTPPGDLTVFFNRVQTFHKTHAPKTPKGKLIDFDTTIDDSSCSDSDDATFHLEDQAVEADLVASSGTIEVNSAKRAPLADIMLEETPRPRDVRTQLSIRTDAPFGKDSAPVQNVTAAPLTAPLSEVINSINLSSMTISTAERSSTHTLQGLLEPTPEEDHAQESDEDNEMEDTIAIPLSFPQITVSSPTYSESDSLTESDLPPCSDSPTDRLFASSSSVLVPPMRRPLSAHSIPADDPRRGSVDLQTSFSMHLQSEEMSFDLLNDKISFLGMAPGADSFWAGGEDEEEEFNMEAEERKMEAAAREYEKAEREMAKMQQKQKSTVHSVTVDVLDAPQHAECAPLPPSRTVTHPKQPEADPEIQKPRQLLTRMAVFSVPADIADSVAEEEANRGSSALTAIFPSQPAVCRQSTPERSQPGESKDAPAEAVTATVPEVASSTMADLATPTSPPLIPEVPIPALRINKKTWKVHGRTESMNSVASSVSSSGTSTSTSVSSGSTNATSGSSTHDANPVPRLDMADKKVADLPSSSSADLAAPARAPRTVIRGVQRPPAGSEMLGSAVIVPSTALSATGQQRPAGQNKLRAASSSAAEARSRFAAAGVQRPNLQQGQRAMPSHMMQGAGASKAQKSASTAGGNGPASTVNAGRAPTVPASRSGGGVGGSLRAPTRYGTVSGASSAAASALPRPASRLPAPSTGALRGKDAKTFGTSARMGTGARRAF